MSLWVIAWYDNQFNMNINSWLFLTRFVNSLTIIESISTIMNNCAVIHTLAGNPLEFFGLVCYTFQNFHGVKAYNTLKKLYQILYITDVLVFLFFLFLFNFFNFLFLCFIIVVFLFFVFDLSTSIFFLRKICWVFKQNDIIQVLWCF